MKRTAAVLCAISLCAGLLVACSPSGASNASSPSDNADYASVRMGTMPTEDFLPMWVAQNDGFFEDADVNVEIVSFDSAQALSAAIAAGQIDMAMVDVPRAVKLAESGTPVVMEWVTLGTEPSQGRFGVVAPADAPYDTLEGLAQAAQSGELKTGVGVAANTVPEYVFDMLCQQADIDPATIPTEEVASLPERYSLVASGNLSAAALPGSMLALAEATGLKVLADDASGDNVSQSVMIATKRFADENDQAIIKVAQAWDAACDAIMSDSGAYIALLSEKANLNSAIAESYPVSEYPYAVAEAKTDASSATGVIVMHPTANLVDPQIEWMAKKGYSSADITYDANTGEIIVA